jgi:ring-1,2-phenylacetyl-CoA epoxidase subunit PaaA
LMMFGPSDKESLHSADTMKWKIKRFSNDDLRQKFIDATVPQGHYLGLTFPDPDLAFEAASGHWRIGEIDWSEFKRVLAGEGPCNRQRMGRARAANADGAWVRAAALAYARKRAERATATPQAAE